MIYDQLERQSPFLGSEIKKTLEMRALELLGVCLIILSFIITMVIATYSPEDPSWISATDAPIKNFFGAMGATMIAPFMLILGWATWFFAILSAGWGLRCLFHKGSEKALGRLIFAPIAIAILALYFASLIPPEIWTHSFGMGGLFGDTFLIKILDIPKSDKNLLVNLVSFVSGAVFLILGLFCLGFSKIEIVSLFRFLCVSLMAPLKLISISSKKHKMPRRVDKINRARFFRNETEISNNDTNFIIPPAPSWDPEDDNFSQSTDEHKPGLLSGFARIKNISSKSKGVGFFATDYQQNKPPVEENERIRKKIGRIIKDRIVKSVEQMSEKTSEVSSARGECQSQNICGNEEAVRIEPLVTSATPKNNFLSPQVNYGSDEKKDPFASFVDKGGEGFLKQAEKIESKRVVKLTNRKAIVPSTRARQEAQPSLQFEEKDQDYELPQLNLLTEVKNVVRQNLSDEALEENARLLEAVLEDYGVRGEIVTVRPGPVVTMYELEPAPGLKASRVVGLSDDIARSMAALSARVSTVPGRSVIGIELPNENREKVMLREILSSKAFGDGNQKLPLALGKEIGGEAVVANLAKMPHLLIAGTTGSGKSVAINTMILSLLYKLTPDECRLIMIDPKMLELSVYDGIPHLLTPVVTDPKKAVIALKWVVGEMEERYRKMSKMGVRNIDGFNSRVQDAVSRGELFKKTIQTGFDDETGDPIYETEEFLPEKMPYIVVIVDEMADLMMVAGKEIEACIQRLAQMARASGIHLIMATQRPSVDVITGTIKANFPTRISFQVTSKIDSRTILGEMGAEQLLGMGDMLYLAGGSKISRCHGPFVSDEEVEEVVNSLKAFGPPKYITDVLESPTDDQEETLNAILGLGGGNDAPEEIFDQAVAIVMRDRKCSTSYIQRKLSIGYNKAARLVEQMEDQGLVSPANHVGKREVLVTEHR